jgi:pyrimidine deaminase RibD-like protein
MKLSSVLSEIKNSHNQLPPAFNIDQGVEGGSPTDFMKIAIFLASKSKQENPVSLFGEKIPQPKIGAVLVVGGKAFCSGRSGFKIGDHAEYTVIDKMASQEFKDLSSAVLYTTLEPCTPESRKQWTECCSRIIVDNSIKKVFVGSIDSNPLVTGLGIKHMKDNDIDVQFFNFEFSEELKGLNREFFAFFEKIADPKTLKIVDDSIGDDLDKDAVRIYCQKTGKNSNAKAYGTDSGALFLSEMIKRGLIRQGNGLSKVDVSNSFALAFFKKPSTKTHGYQIAFYDERRKNKKTDQTEIASKRGDIFGSVVLACAADKSISNATNNIFLKLLKEYGYESSMTKGFPELKRLFPSETSARELIINAIVHNDYKKCPCISFRLYEDHIEIINAAKVFDGDLVRLNSGTMPSVPQNPELMEIFEEADLAEHHHFGMNEIKDHGTKIYYAHPEKRDDKNQEPNNQIFDKETIKGINFLITRISVKSA